jgi:multidrug efflux pump subunit AcrB
MLQPLAIAVIGGLLLSVLLSLIVTPVIYYILTSKRHDQTTAETQAV